MKLRDQTAATMACADANEHTWAMDLLRRALQRLASVDALDTQTLRDAYGVTVDGDEVRAGERRWLHAAMGAAVLLARTRLERALLHELRQENLGATLVEVDRRVLKTLVNERFPGLLPRDVFGE